MQQQTHNLLEKAVLESNNNVYSLSAQIVQLRVVQQATSHLMDKIDEITHKGWHENSGMAYASILEIQDTLRLIDMAFNPLFKEMSEEVKTLNIHAQELYETVIECEVQQEAALSNC